jgi:hypothetical protein
VSDLVGNGGSMRVTERQFETLRELESAVRVNVGARITALLVGGWDGSHHSSTLAALCKKGLAVRKKWHIVGACGCKVGSDAQFGHRCKGSCTYDITEQGRALLASRSKEPKSGPCSVCGDSDGKGYCPIHNPEEPKGATNGNS